MCDGVYQNMAVVAGWMKSNGESIRGSGPLAGAESSSVPAVASGSRRFLFAVPQFKGGEYDENYVTPKDETITLKGVRRPAAVTLLGDGSALEYGYDADTVSVKLPASKRTKPVDVGK